MKTFLSRARTTGFVAVLLAGSVYSILILVATPKPVYAAICDCNEEFVDAENFCLSRYGDPVVDEFTCPYLAQGRYQITCDAAPSHLYVLNCD